MIIALRMKRVINGFGNPLSSGNLPHAAAGEKWLIIGRQVMVSGGIGGPDAAQGAETR